MKIDKLLTENPFESTQAMKEKIFFDAMMESLEWHYNNCELFQKFCNSNSYDLRAMKKLEDIPYLPISIFKEVDLVSGKKELIEKVVLSSATTSGKPSKIALDKVTIKRQQLALKSIIENFLGTDRKHFIVFDAADTAQKKERNISSRGSAIRGMAQFARSMTFILNDKLEFDKENLKKIVRMEQKSIFFGFTGVIYSIYRQYKDDKEIREFFASMHAGKLLHIGGWKKVKDVGVTKDEFNAQIGEFLGVEKGNVIDMYGMTEQLGTVYPDCEFGFKHMPLYSDIIIRDANTFKPIHEKKSGLIQLLTPIPNSYPGISLLTEDVGEMQGVDDCPCGRKGKYFLFKRRLESAPLKGCGDTL